MALRNAGQVIILCLGGTRGCRQTILALDWGSTCHYSHSHPLLRAFFYIQSTTYPYLLPKSHHNSNNHSHHMREGQKSNLLRACSNSSSSSSQYTSVELITYWSYSNQSYQNSKVSRFKQAIKKVNEICTLQLILVLCFCSLCQGNYFTDCIRAWKQDVSSQ